MKKNNLSNFLENNRITSDVNLERDKFLADSSLREIYSLSENKERMDLEEGLEAYFEKMMRARPLRCPRWVQ